MQQLDSLRKAGIKTLRVADEDLGCLHKVWVSLADGHQVSGEESWSALTAVWSRSFPWVGLKKLGLELIELEGNALRLRSVHEAMPAG